MDGADLIGGRSGLRGGRRATERQADQDGERWYFHRHSVPMS
jgi:hypothetical protein